MSEKFKEFKPTSWAINNKTSIYVLTLIISIFGYISYNALPKEQFPDIVIPTYVVTTIYPGSSPTDIENLVTRHIEKNLGSESDIDKISSQSMQDVSIIVVEFKTGIDESVAKQTVRDAVDKSKSDLPNDLPNESEITEISFSEFPVLYINLSSDAITLAQLKKVAEDARDAVESLDQVNRIDIIGALDREIQINVDLYKMISSGITFGNLEQAISYENLTVAGGNIKMNGMARSIRVVGEFSDIETIKNIVVTSGSGAQVYLRDIAEVKDDFAEQQSYSRLDGKPVVMLNVVKKSGANLLETIDKTKAILADLQAHQFPQGVNVTFTGDQSRYTRATLDELNNSILMGFILVTIVLAFFMGLTNAIFVGLAVPLSMCIAYIVLPMIGYSMNMLVMFSFIFALGIVVDDAIVVIENTHRIFKQHKGVMGISEAAKRAAGEVFLPIFSGTLTTITPFIPLAFWPGVVGEFMVFIPVTIIITLFASLLVAYIINPIFAVQFISNHDDAVERPTGKKANKIYITTVIISLFSLLFYLLGVIMWGNIVLFVALFFIFHQFFGRITIEKFQTILLPRIMGFYERLLRWVISGKRPYGMLLWIFLLFIGTICLTIFSKPKIIFFPDNQPNTIYVYTELPEGTDVAYTDSITKIIERRVVGVLGVGNSDVESIVANVAISSSENTFDGGGTKIFNKSKVAVNFREIGFRTGISTNDYITPIRESVQGIAGAKIKVDKNQMGPPVGKPINIEISGDDMDELITTVERFKRYIIEEKGVEGIEQLEMDFQTSKPEMLIELDRERANLNGISAGTVGMAIRNALYGKEISKYREGEDQYPIMVRLNYDQRQDIDALIEMPISYRDINSGLFRQIPLSTISTVKYVNSYGAITRIDQQRVITMSSNVLDGYNANSINAQIRKLIPSFEKSKGVEINLTGEQEDQAEAANFLSTAMILALFLIFFILITQFNSLIKPLIILSEVIFSLIGVLLGFVITGMPISVIMTGMGVIALAGIVIRNGILLVEFTDELILRGYKTREAIVEAGKTRIIPVLLTAVSTILGLIPLAIGMNLDFAGLFESFSPHIYFGGDNTAFFGSLAWAIVFGLTFATFLTLLFIPVMYFVGHASGLKLKRLFRR